MQYLQFDLNVAGSFLVRKSEKNNSTYALSLKTFDGKQEHKYVYKHYLLLENEEQNQYWIRGAEK